MTMDTARARRKLGFGHPAWLLAGLMLLGGRGGATVASAQEVLAAGGSHSCAVVFGRLQCWGLNSSGQLGNGTQTSSPFPTPVWLDGTVTAVAAGEYHTCAIVDGGAKCWGYNGDGQLGDGTSSSSTTSVAVSGLGSGVAALATGAYHSCALLFSGGLRCWGDNYYGQLGTGNTQDSPTPMDVVFPPGMVVTAVAAGKGHTCAIASANVFCWGDNTYGQLGTGNYDPSLTPVLVIPGQAVGITAGADHSCAVFATGGVQCWGAGWVGQLGNDTFSQSPDPVTVYRHSNDTPPLSIPLSGVTAVTAGGDHTCAIAGDGAYCWGHNESGELGIGSTADMNFASSVADLSNPVTAIAAGEVHTCAVAGGEVICWGSDEFGQVGDAAVSPYIFAPAVSSALNGFSGISAGGAHGCAFDNGTAYCWGSNRRGQLGTGTLADAALPQAVISLGSGFIAAATGYRHSCALRDSGDVLCWGAGGSGQLGNNSFGSSSTPVFVLNLYDALSIAAGRGHTCAVRTGGGGGVQCWGYNSDGELGDGTSSDSTVPVTVQLGNFPFPALGGATAVTAGTNHSCAIANGGAYCWGSNDHGQLGNGSTTEAHRAVQVVGLGSGIASMSAGRLHTCALVSGGVQCWGGNGYGQLGNGANADSSVPVLVSGLGGVSAIASGNYHTCSVVDGGVQCWGANYYGQLGNGSFDDSNVPVTAIPPGSGITEITAGEDYTCATGPVNGQPATRCWGNGMYGRLANGELGYRNAPVPVVDRILKDGYDDD